MFRRQGLLALNYKEHSDFELVQGEVTRQTSPDNNSNSELATSTTALQLVRINVFRDHRQTVQYIAPTDVAFARQAEILIIDEAAAIPLPVVSKLFGPYLVFLSSTVNGYEGTGRALRLKLMQVNGMGENKSGIKKCVECLLKVEGFNEIVKMLYCVIGIKIYIKILTSLQSNPSDSDFECQFLQECLSALLTAKIGHQFCA